MPIKIKIFIVGLSVAQDSLECAGRHIPSTLAKE